MHRIVKTSDHFTVSLLECFGVFLFCFPEENLSLEKVLRDSVGQQ